MSEAIDVSMHRIKKIVHDISDIDPAHQAHQYKEIIVTLLDAIDRVKEHLTAAGLLMAEMRPDVAGATAKTILDLTMENIEESIIETLYGERYE